MAISRYLTSNRNLTGCALALIGLGLHFAGFAGRFWPLVVAGLYVVGVLIAPARKVRLAGGPEDLRAAFDLLVRRARKERMPKPVMARLRRIETLVAGLLARPEELAAQPESWLTVDRVVRIDLPESFEAYLNLPRWYSGRKSLPSTGRSAEHELVEQLRSIERTLDGTAERVLGERARWMVEHGRRLDEQADRADP